MTPDSMSRDELLERAGAAAEALGQDPRVLLVYVFGSSLDASRPAARDLDLAVLTAPPLSLEELLRLRADLALEVRAPVDLVSLNSVPVVLAYEIIEDGRCLYSRNPDIEAGFVTRTRSRYWDFAPFREEQWRLTGRRIEERLRGT